MATTVSLARLAQFDEFHKLNGFITTSKGIADTAIEVLDALRGPICCPKATEPGPGGGPPALGTLESQP